MMAADEGDVNAIFKYCNIIVCCDEIKVDQKEAACNIRFILIILVSLKSFYFYTFFKYQI